MDVVAWMRRMKKYQRKKTVTMTTKDRREYLEDHYLKANQIAPHSTKAGKDRLSHQAMALGIESHI